MHNRTLLPFLVAAFVLTSCVTGSAAVKYKTSGTFADSSGSQHAWSINDAHTLLWDAAPYIPVGGVFVARSLSSGAAADAYDADIKDLQAFKATGITDVVLKGSGPITSGDPAALQKLNDNLEANGFTYGIELDDAPKDPLPGYVISPNRYRLEGPTDDSTIKCNWPGVDSAMYVVVSTYDNQIKANGGALVRDGNVTINLASPLKAGEVLIVYPHKTLQGDGNADLWGGYPEYRDRVLAYFKGIKFGKGLRFFLEPFTCKMDFSGEMVGFLPDSAGFRLGFEAFLTQKYKHQGGVNAAWGLNENLDSIERAARLMPMWTSGRGVPYAYDKASAHMFPVNPTSCGAVWQDIIDYRDTSTQQYMNTIADTLRKQVANVPVIFRSGSYSRIFANPYGMGGFDGLSAKAYGTGEAPVDRVAGSVYALAEESGKTAWFLVAGTQASSDSKSAYASESSMAGTLDSFREVGSKGFFVDNLTPEQAKWLAAFKGKIGKNWTDFKPEVVFYPTDPATGGYVKRIARDTWWLPTLRKGNINYIGDGLYSYTILGEGKAYVWSGAGSKTVTMSVGAAGVPSVDYPAGVNLSGKKGGTFTLKIEESPTVIRGMPFTEVFPRETAQTEIDRLAKLIPNADKEGIDVKKARGTLDSAQSVFKNGQPYIAYGIAQDGIRELLSVMGPDLWLEGERSPASNFGSVTAAPGASGALALVLDTEQDAPLNPYSATYTFESTANSSHEIWMAGSPASDASPASYNVDGGPWTPISATDGKVASYGPGLGWYKLGVANLIPGSHTITIRVDGKRAADNRYYFAVDAIVLSPRGFVPNGIVKPY